MKHYPLAKDDILIADSILRKVFKDKVLRGAKNPEDGNILLVSDFSYFETLLGNFHSSIGKRERALIKKILAIHPGAYGIPGKKTGVHAVPKNLVKIPPHTYEYKGEPRVIWTQYMTKNAYDAFEKMNHAMKKDIGSGLFISSGYRSPAYQLHAFLRQWQISGYSFAKTIRLVALPGYSEHCDPKRQAMDIITEQGIPDDLDGYKQTVKNLQKTKEYQWMLVHAREFGFTLSYPSAVLRTSRAKGIKFEPWHWRYIG